MKNLLLACLIGAALTAPAYAQSATTAQTDVRGPYAGIGVTTSRHVWEDRTRTAVRVFGGYDFNRAWGVEAGFSRQDDFHIGFVVPESSSGRTLDTKFSSRSGYLAGKASLFVSERLAIVTKLGVAANSGKIDRTDPFTNYNQHTSSTRYGLYAGIGLQYQLTEKVGLSLDLERMGRSDGGHKPERVSLNASYRF